MDLHLQLCLLSVCGVLFTPSSLSVETCVKTGPCSCRNSQGTVDLTPLANDNATAAYKDFPGGIGQFYYSYNPCKSFTEGSEGCDNVAVCQTDQMGNYYSLGIQSSSSFLLDASQNLQLKYTATTEVKRTSWVTLICDPNIESKFAAVGENPPGSAMYYFSLHTKYACLPPTTTSTKVTATTTTTTATATTTTATTQSTASPTNEPVYMRKITIMLAVIIALLFLILVVAAISLLFNRYKNGLTPTSGNFVNFSTLQN